MANDIAVERYLANLLGHGESLPDFAGWFTEALWSIESKAATATWPWRRGSRIDSAGTQAGTSPSTS